MIKIAKKILYTKIKWRYGFFIILVTIFGAVYQIKAFGGLTVFAGIVTTNIPMAGCTQYEWDACSGICPRCECGEHDEIYLANIYGGSNETLICKGAGYKDPGMGMFQINSTVFGLCINEQFSVWNPATCNVWSIFQF